MHTAIGALQTLLWIFQSRIYENGRPSVQECVFNGILAVLFAFGGAWQLYQTFANEMPLPFLCDTSSYDNQVRCRLWQTEVVGCCVSALLYFLMTIFCVVLFRSRPLHLKDLPEDFTLHTPSDVTSSLAKQDADQRERDRKEAEAEHRAMQDRQQQQQRQFSQRPIAPQQRPSNPYMLQQSPSQHQMQHQQQNPPIAPGPGQLRHQGSGYNMSQDPYRQNTYAEGGESYYNENYAHHQQLSNNASYDLSPATSGYSQQNLLGGGGRANSPLAAQGFTMEPLGFTETSPAAANVPYGSYGDYAYGNFNPAETFDDPTSQEAQAHLAYANQLREQQLYHQNMADVLTKQQQQKQQLRMQQQRQQSKTQMDGSDNQGYPPASGSTANFYPPPSQGSSIIPPLPSAPLQRPPSANSLSATGGGSGGSGSGTPASSRPDLGYTSTVLNSQSGMMTPGSNFSSQRIQNSPQLYSDAITNTESVYSDDRHKENLLGDLRRGRGPQGRNSQGISGGGFGQGSLDDSEELESLHGYKVPISQYGGEADRRRASQGLQSESRHNSASYTPPPPSRKS
ncbi:hypothetical protein BGZ83_002923 [Gryganskiella cystojenkinii]|nr:hypothetical protein BGZ83_002923 [Gryganskiella cystojenkinii]